MVPASPDYALGSGETFANFSPKFGRAQRARRDFAASRPPRRPPPMLWPPSPHSSERQMRGCRLLGGQSGRYSSTVA